MARHEQVKVEKDLNDQRRLRNKPEQPPELLMAADEGINSLLGQAVNPSPDQHARLLAGAGSEMQRVKLTRQLQRNYGNRYVQRVIEHSRNSESHPQKATSINIKSNNSNSLTLGFSAVLKNNGKAEEAEPTQSTIEETTELPTAYDSIDPAHINLTQQTTQGGSALRDQDHGSYTPYFTKNVTVQKSGGIVVPDWEVRGSMDVVYHWTIQSLNKIDINSPYADVVGPDNWRDIVTDLRPAGGGVPRSPRLKYWCSDLSAQHEMFHISDCMQAFTRFLPEKEQWLRDQTVSGKLGAERAGLQALNDLEAQVLSYMGEGPNAPQETRAYGAGVGAYEARAQAVEDRAYQEGWMDESDEDYYEEDHDEEEEDEYDDGEVEEEEGESESWWDDLWEDIWEDEEDIEDEEQVEKEEKKIDNEEYGYGNEEEPYGEGEQDYLYGGETPEEEEYGYGYGEESYGEEDSGYEDEYSGGEEENGGYEESYEEEEDYGGGWGYEDEYSEEDYY